MIEELDVFWRQVHADVGFALRRKVHGIITGATPQLDHGGEGTDIVRDMFFIPEKSSKSYMIYCFSKQ